MPGGRPTLCTPELIEKARLYLESEWESLRHIIPSNVGLAVFLSIGESTLYRWAEDEDSEFREILASIKAKQQLTLLAKGLTGDFNAAITKLVLGKHGYHDKQDTELTGKGGEPLSIVFNGVSSDGRRTN